MDLWQMRYFIQIYNDKSLTKAAKNLYISEQSLSKTIKHIEDEFSIILFERSPKGLKPTAYAELLLESSLRVLREYDAMVGTFYNNKQIYNQLITIGISNVLYTNRLKTVICDFQNAHPEITLEFYELGSYACEKYMDDNLVDICITIKPDNKIKYEFIPLSVCKPMLFVNKQNNLSKENTMNMKKLQHENFIMLPTDSKIRKLTIDYCRKCNFNPNIVITTSNIDFIIELIDLNKGVAVLPEYQLIKASMFSNNITAVCFDDSLPKIEAGFIIKKGFQTSSVVNRLIQYLSDSLNSNPIIE